jgi:glutamine amidotransferase
LKIAIIDYGVGNLRSVEKAFSAQGIAAEVSSDEAVLRSADKLVLPGVGAFAACMQGLRKSGFDGLVLESAGQGKPLLGVCVGLQMLFDVGYEFGSHEGLGLLRGSVERFPEDVRVPHVGWNQVSFRSSDQNDGHALLDGLPDQTFFYFVHSYYVKPLDRDCILGETDYASRFASICGRGNVFGVQFHPEKSQAAGLQLFRNFAAM